MLTHLPGRMSQPSRKGVTSNILILRCSFHKTAKRLSITSLTHLLRLHTKIQSSIVRHDKMSVLVIPVILLQHKNGKEIRSTTKHWIVKIKRQNFHLQTVMQKKITDWITSQKPICRRHPINLNNNIKDISQKKKICLKALTIQLSIAYLCDTTMKGWSCLFPNATQLYTRCTKNFWMTFKPVIHESFMSS